MVKSMIEHLGAAQKLDSPRKQRFPDRFLEDINRLVGLVTTEILFPQRRDGKESRVCLFCSFYAFILIWIEFIIMLTLLLFQSALTLNIYLAFFLHDLLSVMDRGFIFSLIRDYCRLLGEDKAQHPHDVVHVTSLEVNLYSINLKNIYKE